MPKSASGECRHTSTETRLLPLWRYAEIDVISQPVICVHVPVGKVGATVLRTLQSPWIDILKTIPRDSASFGIDSVVAQTGEDTCSLGQRPNSVVFQASSESEEVNEPDSLEEAEFEETWPSEDFWVDEG